MTSKLVACALMAAFIVALPVTCLVAADSEQVIQITAKKFEYAPKEIQLKKGIPAVLEFTSLDRMHGFNCPALKIRTDIRPGQVNRLRFVPDKAGTFPFHCDDFCGVGHEAMRGTIIVTE